MSTKCQVEEVEGRELDSYDMIAILGLLKEHDWKGILRRYTNLQSKGGTGFPACGGAS